MSYCIIIRGPLGCGKSTIAKKLSKILKAKYFAVDKILDNHDLTKEQEAGFISQKSFIKANEIIARKAKLSLDNGKPVVFDGNFYWKSQIEDLISRLDFPHYVFTLKAPPWKFVYNEIASVEKHMAKMLPKLSIRKPRNLIME